MLHAPFTPFRNAFKRDLKEITDEELIELFYTSLRWINYFQDEDDLFVYLKIFEDIYMEVKRRGLKCRWTNKDIKKYRIMGQKMYYGSLSVKELEWRLGHIIMYAIPVYRNFVRSKLYLVRERIPIIIEAIHQQNSWSELEYNKDLLNILDAPFFSYDNFRDIYQVLRALFLFGENIIIFFLFIFYAIIKQVVHLIWAFISSYFKYLRNIIMIFAIFAIMIFFSCFIQDALDAMIYI